MNMESNIPDTQLTLGYAIVNDISLLEWNRQLKTLGEIGGGLCPTVRPSEPPHPANTLEY